MTRYLVTVVNAVSVPVEAESEEEARELMEEFADLDNYDFKECADSSSYEISDCEEVDPTVYHTAFGIDSRDPCRLHDLDGED